jgi:hypothetical protein
MRGAVVLVLVGGMLAIGACGIGEDGESKPDATSTTKPRNESVVIRTRITIAATPGAEPIATGEILQESTLGGSQFCPGGTILDSHASADPAVKKLGLVDRAITCPDGTVRMVFTPKPPQGGRWTIISGTGAFEGLRGNGKFQITYAPDPDAPARETYTGTVSTR